MMRRGADLREHIRWTAKDVFLELGFERASMDVVASRAKTSKRSVYAHFENKEKLFLAVIELVRGLFLTRLGEPGDYPGSPSEALTVFLGRYVEALLFENSIRMFRLSAAETDRFPDGSAQYFEVVFTEVETRISNFLVEKCACSSAMGTQATQRLIGRVLYPQLPRTLFGVDRARSALSESVSPEFDLNPIKDAVTDTLQSLNQSSVAT